VASSIKGLDGGSIGSDNSSPVEKIRVSTPVNAGGSGQSAATPSSDSDSVQITNSARTLASLAQAVSDTPDIDTNRVAALQQAISSGSYHISPEGIADKMLQLEQDLGGTRQR
jgi:negative regulator of flagellin synthesis FlgM